MQRMRLQINSPNLNHSSRGGQCLLPDGAWRVGSFLSGMSTGCRHFVTWRLARLAEPRSRRKDGGFAFGANKLGQASWQGGGATKRGGAAATAARMEAEAEAEADADTDEDADMRIRNGRQAGQTGRLSKG